MVRSRSEAWVGGGATLAGSSSPNLALPLQGTLTPAPPACLDLLFLAGTLTHQDGLTIAPGPWMTLQGLGGALSSLHGRSKARQRGGCPGLCEDPRGWAWGSGPHLQPSSLLGDTSLSADGGPMCTVHSPLSEPTPPARSPSLGRAGRGVWECLSPWRALLGYSPQGRNRGFSWCAVFNRCYYGLESDILAIIFLGIILCPNNAIRGST